MKRLTTFSRILITLVILLILFFGAKYFLGDKIDAINSSNSSEPTTETVQNQDNTTNTSKSSNDSKPAIKKSDTNFKKSSFNYNAPKPIGGKLMGVVELGASGFNSFIIKKDNDDNWEKTKYEWGNSMVVDGMASDSDIINGLKRYIGNILDYGVAGKHIHFVVSSGAKKEPEIVKIVTALKNMGYVVNEVTPEQEGQYALKSVLPKSYYDKAYVVDIGSGNTKVSWLDGGRIVAKEGPGAKYYRKEVSDSQAYNDSYKIGLQVPKNVSKTCFIIGGVPFNMAKVSKNSDERYTVLGGPAEYTKLAEKKGKKVESGLNIYQGLIDGSGCKQYIFDWNANFTIGFLLSLPG